MAAAHLTATARVPLVVALVLAFAGAGCSFQLGSMFDNSREADTADITGSIPPTATAATAETRPETDVALRAAARELLARNEGTASLPWQNPRTGASGMVTPIAKPYPQAGLTCRDFLASYIRDGSESWLQGEACHAGKGSSWEVRSLKPWTRS
jgi:surface antigen